MNRASVSMVTLMNRASVSDWEESSISHIICPPKKKFQECKEFLPCTPEIALRSAKWLQFNNAFSLFTSRHNYHLLEPFIYELVLLLVLCHFVLEEFQCFLCHFLCFQCFFLSLELILLYDPPVTPSSCSSLSSTKAASSFSFLKKLNITFYSPFFLL